MANLTETSSYDATIPELETSDPVQGGPTGVSNFQAKALANRTSWLKGQVDTLVTQVASIVAQLAAPLVTAAAGNESVLGATTAFVHRAQGGIATVNVGGGVAVQLTSDQWGCGIILLTGAITADLNVIFPTRGDRWLVVNRTTGLFQITCKTAAGAGVKVAQGRQKCVFCDGTAILDEETDLSTRPKLITAAYTAAVGESLSVDQTGGAFPVAAPLNPAEGDQFKIRGNFATSNLTVTRNGQLIRDRTGAPQASDYVANRNNLSATFTFTGGAWLVTQG